MPASEYSPEVIDRICAQLANGRSMAEICRQDDFPGRATVYGWMERDNDLRTRIARAREIGQDAAIDECRDIVDTATPEDWQVARLRVWHRQWEAAKRAPKTFGDKVQHTGADGDGPVQFVVTRVGKPSAE